MVERRIKAAKFPAVKSLDSFDFAALPSLNKALVMELARSEYIERREIIIAIGNSGTRKSHVALGLGLTACQKGLSVGFTTAAALVHELIEARDDKRLLRLQRQLASHKLLIVDELSYVPLSQTGAELLLNELIAQARQMTASVTAAEQHVAAITADLAKLPEIKAGPVRSIGSFPKRESGWQWTSLPKAS
jgi:DNA replication protein DnaC